VKREHLREHLAVEDLAEVRQPVGRWVIKLALVLAPIVLLGEVGHEVLGRIGQVVAHHLFHILFLGGAVVVFAAYAIVDIRRHGRPSFSWRLHGPDAVHEATSQD
jgi:hypothetical protein